MSSTDAAGVKKRQRGRKNNSAAAGGGGSGKATTKAPAAARTPIDPNASDESLLVESPQQFALRMRKLLATLFREQAQATGDRYPLAAPKLGTSQSFSSEQIWGQLSVLYAPVLKKAAKSVSRLRVSEEEEEADAPSAAPAAKKKGSKKATFADEEYDDEDDASMSGGFSDSAASVALSSDAEVDKLESRLRRRNRGGKRGGKGVDPDAWRYALGKPSELEDEDLSEDDDAIGDDDMAPKHKRGRDEAAELDAGDDDDLEGLEDDFEGESDMAGDGDEEEELGDDASEADSAAALRELYGSDAEAGDDDDDEERDDDDDDDPMNEENFDEFMDDRSSQGVADDEDDDGAAAAASPFGPAAAPENPLDFTDIDNNKKLTAFEKDEQKRLRVARDLEMSRVHGADWAMKGEVAAGARPRDSLIDTTLDFEHALPPAPVITEYFTGKLEDRIKRRVADNNFDDVERKVLQTAPEDLQSTKRDEALDAQKSKLSLMDLYEKEFLEKQAAAERAEGGPAMAEALTEIERDELKAVQMWKRLSQHLDALSNFYFTPKPVNPEVEARVRAVQNQAPAITLEPVGMNAVAKEDVLAPQDVFRPKRGIHTDAAGSELTSDERKAIRRAAKANTKAAEGRKEKQHAANDKKKTAAKKASGGDAAGKKS